ncbi:MAG: alpha-glycosidase [Lachnospiraceae bacterium]|nr:alpha-glycosidase [Lachnospiraceae bacterium]
MEFSAIRHEADKRYCFALEKGKFVIRLQTKKDDMEKVILHRRDKYIPLKLVDTRESCEMEKVASDRFYDYYEAVVEIDVICLRYYFELVDKAGAVSYFGNCEFYEEEIDSIHFMFNCPQNLREEERYDIPQWANNKIVYQIFPSRYASSEAIDEELWYKTPIGPRDDLKGDLRGVIEHFDHLLELGVDIIYMTPIFKSPSAHKYDTIDYYQIDSSFGTEEDLRELVEMAHGMHVILDAVFNHTSPKFFAFADVAEKGRESKYWDWYYIEDYPLKAERFTKPNFKTFAYFGGMPKLNLQNPEVAEYVINVGRYWIEKCDIDGWRLDVSDEISHMFWKQFRKAIREVKRDALFIGEVWYFARDFMEGDEWDTVMNYDFYFGVQKLIAEESITVSRFMETLGRLRGNLHNKVYPVLWNLIDSHDTARFLHVSGENKDKLKIAAALQLLLPGMPFIYYGDEYAMTGGDDPDCRRGMLWDEARQDKEMFAWYRELIRIRKAYPAITEGKVTACECDDERGIVELTRELGVEKVEIIFEVKECKVRLKVQGVDVL